MVIEKSVRTSAQRVAADVVVVGAGLVGLAVALELHDRGAGVVVIERGRSLAGASIAAAGMLGADDPHNPAALRPLARLSADRYATFLRRIEELSGVAVPFQTEATVQYLADGSTLRLQERSLDPRQLAGALRAAVRATSITLMEETQIAAVEDVTRGLAIRTAQGAEIGAEMGAEIQAEAIVYAAGAWTGELVTDLSRCPILITPRKGQMLRVRVPEGLALDEVHRSGEIYIVPRTRGAQAGTALIGATVEDAGFDTSVRGDDLDALRARAAALIPEFASEAEAPLVEAWAGLRPATPDLLPVLGGCRRERHYIASGHYRNGILLAPATAVVIADLVEGKVPPIDISAFSADRSSSCA